MDISLAHACGNQRLQDIISRIGEIWVTPELAHIMLFPTHALAYASGATTRADFPGAYRAVCHDPDAILDAMDDLPAYTLNSAHSAKFLVQFQTKCLPIPITTAFRQPIHVCAWKLEQPPRVCLYTGEHPSNGIDPSSFAPHALSKVLLEERSKRPNPSSIHLVTHDNISPAAIRNNLLHYAQTVLTPYRAQLKQGGDALDHTLEEAVACFVQAPTRNHTQIELNQSPPWDKNHIDSR